MAGNAGKGRPKGALNRATKDVKEAAREYGPAAIKTLSILMKTADSDAAKIAACKELLDRAYGKATQNVDANVTHFHEDALDSLDS